MKIVLLDGRGLNPGDLSYDCMNPFGDVTIYERRDGIALDPTLMDIFPNVKNPTDKRPDEIHCTDLAPTLDQTVIINMMIATVMMAIFRI